MIGIVTDSNAQLPESLIERYDLHVVPLRVSIDGVDYEEGVDLDADQFYARFQGGASPNIATSQPSPGRFLATYRELAARGVTEILSIHIGAEYSGTLNAASAAAARSPVPVHLVDTKVASFGIAFAVWEAAEALRNGRDAAGAIAAALAVIPRIGNVFVVGALELGRAGGRIMVEEIEAAGPTPVLSLRAGAVEVVTRVFSVADAALAMAEFVLAAGGGLRVASGIADAAARPLSDALEAQLGTHPSVAEFLHYRIGPSVGAHTGPGTAGVFFVAS